MYFYRAEKEKGKKRRKFYAKALFFGGLVFLSSFFTGGIYLIRYSDFLQVKKIEISGVQSVNSAELLADLKNFLVRKSKIASFLGADNILVWQTDVSPFLNNHSLFKNLGIKTDYFSRNINIEVKERGRTGIWCLNNDCFWFDNDGMAFSRAPLVETEILIKINDLSGRDLKIGDLVLPQNFFENLTAIFKVLEASNLKIKTLNIGDLSLAEISTEKSDLNPKIYFSLRFNPEFSIAAINSLKNSGKWNKINYVDFRVENRAYYK
ncbi:MAG: hypothetical protein AAB757_02285 [Patescibacteria group bacterium]